MSSATSDAPAEATPDEKAIRLVDCDVHPTFAQPWTAELEEYFPAEWKELFRAGEEYKSKVPPYWPGVSYQLPGNGFYPRRGSPVRLNLLGPNGEMPASDAKISAKEHLDAGGIDRAVLIPQGIFGIGAFPNPAVASVIAHAANRWMAERWYDVDNRWRAVLAVAPQDPDAAVREIEKWKDHPAFVGIFISLGANLLGRKEYWPIYERAEEYGLAITLHVTGTEGIYTSGASFAGGLPVNHMEYRYMLQQPYQANLANLIAMGVFERFKNLKVVFTETGFAWLPELMWKLDSFWKAAREETPWLTRRPSEYIFDNVRFTTQPFIEPDRREFVAQMIEMVHGERTLLFATDYPHWDQEEHVHLQLPREIRSRVLSENALDAYPRLSM